MIVVALNTRAFITENCIVASVVSVRNICYVAMKMGSSVLVLIVVIEWSGNSE